MDRYLSTQIKKDLSKKIVLISGPRQSGKTTLSKMLLKSHAYLNYDLEEHRKIFEKKEWDRKKNLIIFDELHKMKKWKSWLKGIYDVEGIPPALLVTGSAKLDTFRKVGDSLAGRFFSFRLYPFDLKELKKNDPEIVLEKSFESLLKVSGFPEPYLNGSVANYKRWRKTHLDIILRQDLITLEKVTDIVGIENLIRLLRSRVGSTISYSNLARDLDVDPKTVKNWLNILERLFVIFKVTPYSKKIKDSILKAPKYYFYDTAVVDGDDGAKLENLVAFSLLKELHYLEDVKGEDVALQFLRTKKGEELDFIVSINNRPKIILEVKWSDDSFSKNIFFFKKYFPETQKIQLVANLKTEKTHDHYTEMRKAANWLATLDLSK